MGDEDTENLRAALAKLQPDEVRISFGTWSGKFSGVELLCLVDDARRWRKAQDRASWEWIGNA